MSILILDEPACGPAVDGETRRPSQEHTWPVRRHSADTATDNVSRPEPRTSGDYARTPKIQAWDNGGPAPASQEQG